MNGNEEWRESKWEKWTNNEVTRGRVASSQKLKGQGCQFPEIVQPKADSKPAEMKISLIYTYYLQTF